MNREWAEKNYIKSYLGIPLRLEGGVVGVLNCFTREIREFQRDEIELMQDFADQAAIAIDKAKHVESLEAHFTTQDGLIRALRRIPSGLRVENVLETILAEGARVMGTDGCCIDLPDADGGDLRVFASQGVSDEYAGRIAALSKPFPSTSAFVSDPEKKDPLVIQDMGTHPDFGEVHRKEGHRVLAAFPLRVGDRNVGALFFFWKTPQEIDGRKLDLGRAFADQAAIAIENARLLAEAEKRATNLEVLEEIGKAIGSTLDLEELFKTAAEQVKRAVPCDESALYILGQDNREVSAFFVDTDAEDRKSWITTRRDLSGSQFEEILRTKKPFYPAISHHPLGGWIIGCELECFFLSVAFAVEPGPVGGWS